MPEELAKKSTTELVGVLQAGFIDVLWAFTDSEGPSEGMKTEIGVAGRMGNCCTSINKSWVYTKEAVIARV